MKRIRKWAAVNVVAALIAAGIPAMAADRGNDGNRGRVEYQSTAQRDRGFHNDQSDRDRDARRGDQDRGYVYGYTPAPVYAPAPVYSGPVYEDGYYAPTHDGRTAAIIGGSAAAGALIGAAAGHGEGAVIGAVIGGIAGAAASTAVDHHR